MTHSIPIALMSIGLSMLVACEGTSTPSNQNANQTSGAVCGDGVMDPGEVCDDGAQNSDVQPDACRSDCRSAHCGDGVVDSGEACDDGSANSDRVPDACRKDCTLPVCGDGVLDAAESCDDGAVVDGDGCSGACRQERNFECFGAPSVCVCRTYFHGARCTDCVVYVDQRSTAVLPTGESWALAYPTIQEGIDQAARVASRCEVWVAAGTYRIYRFGVGSTVRLQSGISLYGGFQGDEAARGDRDPGAHATILDGGDDTGQGGVFHVLTAERTEDATVDGFTIRGGRASGGLDDASQRGGALYAYAASLSLGHLTIVDNEATAEGGGLYLYASSVRATDIVLRANAATHGGAVYLQDATLHLERATLSHNLAARKGAAIYAASGSSLRLDSSVVYANASWMFFGEAGTAVRVDGSAVLRNCSFLYNLSRIDESAFRGSAQLTNCVFSRNDSPAVGLQGSSSSSHCIHQEGHAGVADEVGVDPELSALPTHVELAVVVAQDILMVASDAPYSVGDVIVIRGDGIPRTLTQVVPEQGGVSPEIHFQPPASLPDGARVVVEAWPAGTTVVEPDLHPAPGSRCIDTGDDGDAPATDRDGQTWADLPGQGDPGTQTDRGAFDRRP